MASDNEWIQKAIKNPGSFTAWCKRNGFKGASESCIQKAIAVAKRTGNKTLLRRAYLARTLKRLAKRRAKGGD